MDWACEVEAGVEHVSDGGEEGVLVPDEGAGGYACEEEVRVCEEEDADADWVHAVPEELGFLKGSFLGKV